MDKSFITLTPVESFAGT